MAPVMFRYLCDMKYPLYILAAVLFIAACSTPEQPQTTLSLATQGKPVDTAGIIEEFTGLLTLTAPATSLNRSFSVTAGSNGDSLRLTITPELVDEHKQAVGDVLDTLVKHPSSWSPADLQLFYTDNPDDVVELLQLDTVNGYPLAIDYASADWGIAEEDTYMTGPLASGAATTYLRYKLRKPLPSSSYSWGLDESMREASEATDIISSLLSAAGPITSSFTVKSVDTAITPLWDSLRMNHRVYIDSLDFSLKWAYVDFPYREYNRFTDQDTMITSSVDKLRSALPYVFHALVVPRLSTVVAAYTWE